MARVENQGDHDGKRKFKTKKAAPDRDTTGDSVEDGTARM